MVHAPLRLHPHPRSPEAAELIRQLSAEMAERYDFCDDGSGHFRPEDVLVEGSVFLVGDVPVACGAARRPDVRGEADVCRPGLPRPRLRRGDPRRTRTPAAAMGYTAVRLETGTRQPDAVRVYERAGFLRIPKFGIHVHDGWSICFEKKL